MKQGELFEKKEVNPTVNLTVTMNKDEKEFFKAFAEKMNIPLSAFVRLACKNFIATEGQKYGKC